MPTAAIELVWAYTYADTVTAILIRDTLSKTVEGHNAMSPEASWNAMLARTRNLGSPGIVSMTISAVDPRILRWWFWSRVAAVFRDELHNLFPESSESEVAGRKHFHAFGIYGKGNSRLPTAQSSSSSHRPGSLPPQSNDADERRKIIDGKDAARSSRTGIRLRHGGSLGYEKDKCQVSVACGEGALLPEVRKASVSTIIVADGFSCKEKIAQETNRHALHFGRGIEAGSWR